MINKEIKVGDKIWPYWQFIREENGLSVVSVKKNKTLVTVEVEFSFFDKIKRMVLYGHASSSMLSGYERNAYRCNEVFTCDWEQVYRLKEKGERESNCKEAGRLLYMLKNFLNG